MISNGKLNKMIIIFSIAIFLFLILPSSIANEDILMNESQTCYIENDIATDASDSFELTENSNAIYVDDARGSDEGTGTSNDPVKTISKGLALVNNGGTIYLNGEFSGEGNSILTLDGTPTNIKFIGMGKSTIDGKHATTFAMIESGIYIFTNISFVNNYKTGNTEELGGAIYNAAGTLTFNNCTFENNTVFGVNRGNGGAIDNSGTLKIVDCTFKNNIANVSNSSGFRKNAADGGAISNVGTLTITNSVFIGNKALRNGGAIRTQDGSTNNIKNCTFKNNLAAYHLSGGSYGGAIYTWDCGLNLFNSTFENNRVYDASGYGGRGGALSINRASGKINVNYCSFVNNTADGKGTGDGQSICIDGSEANINYCTIDSSIYSSSQSVDLNHNWWISNDKYYKPLIENLPSSAAIKTYARLEISTDAEYIDIGDEISIFIDLYWNGTKIKDGINLLPLKTISLEAIGGELKNSNGDFVNGSFKTTLTPNSNEIIIMLKVDNSVIELELSSNETNIKIKYEEGPQDTGMINIYTADIETGYCIAEINNIKYYEEIINNNCNLTIPKVTANVYANISFYNSNGIKIDEKTINLTPKNKTDSKKDTIIEIIKPLTYQASDLKANEIGGHFKILLKDSEGNTIANRTVEIAVDGKIYNIKTNNQGIASIKVNFASANSYAYVILFNGDDSYNGSPLTTAKITVTKKASSIKAKSKTFKVKTKIKTITVTLKTSKNKNDGKTYLSAGKKLTLKIKGKRYTAKTNKKGVAKFRIKLNTKGKFTSTIKFAGDNTYKSSSKKIKIKIK